MADHIALTLDLEADGEQPTGSMRHPSGQSLHFWGWLELIEAVQSCLPQTTVSATAAPPSPISLLEKGNPMNAAFETVSSADGTSIAVERTGDGPPVILIGGAFNDRSTVAGLAAVLAPEFTAVTYDRRGRGDSGDTPPYAVEREIDDLAAVIAHAGGPARVFGHSSGAVLALEAAARGLHISKVAAYEPTYVIEGTRPRPPDDLADRLRALIDAGQRDEAAALFLAENADMPAEVIDGMRGSPMWGWFTGLAHTLPYDVTLCGPGMRLPASRLAAITVPVLAIGGGASPPWLPAAAQAVADAVLEARYVTLDGQDHGVLQQPGALRPLLTSHFGPDTE
jgi:pimeloyl-ACP methyl ester carboxylesterase